MKQQKREGDRGKKDGKGRREKIKEEERRNKKEKEIEKKIYREGKREK